MKKFYLSAAMIAATLALPAMPALAQTNEIVIGITVTTTGPAAALGIPERNALEFVVTESKFDIIMGSSTTPPPVAVSTVGNEAGVPHFSLAPFPITPERAKWSVAMPQPVPLMGK